jgi:hypothetical protein
MHDRNVPRFLLLLRIDRLPRRCLVVLDLLVVILQGFEQTGLKNGDLAAAINAFIEFPLSLLLRLHGARLLSPAFDKRRLHLFDLKESFIHDLECLLGFLDVLINVTVWYVLYSRLLIVLRSLLELIFFLIFIVKYGLLQLLKLLDVEPLLELQRGGRRCLLVHDLQLFLK